MPSPESLIANDLAEASDILARADLTHSAMPNRIFYELTAEFSERVGLNAHKEINLSGSLNGMAFSLAQYFGSRAVLKHYDVNVLFNLVNERLHTAGKTESFKPTFPNWPAR